MSNRIEEFLDNDRKMIIVIGSLGCGKTTLIKDALDSREIQYLIPCYNSITTHQKLKEGIDNFLNTKLITGQSGQCMKVLFFDDIDILTSQDRYTNSFLKSIVETSLSNVKIIISCCSGNEKRLTEIKKMCKPEDIYRMTNVKNLDSNHINKNNNNSDYFDKNIYDIVKTILINNDKNINELECVISQDPTLIGFIMYDNYIKFAADNFVGDHPINNNYRRIIEFYKDTLKIEDFAFAYNEYSVVEVANLIRCQSIRKYLSGLVPKQTKRKDCEIKYTQITSRSAQQCNVMKRMGEEMFIDFNNIEVYSNILFSTKTKPNLKTNIGFMSSVYIFNVCKPVDRM